MSSAERRPESARVSCCAASWVGADRAHCCRRTGGCGRVFDNVRLFDQHRARYGCLDPADLGLTSMDGVWRAVLEQPVPRPRAPRRRPASVALSAHPARAPR
ncbi:MAG TPA: hypothetical protein VGH89_28655 [Pseudonocardia sp.]